MRIDANSWYYSPDHGQLCQVIEAQTLWGEMTCRVWLPGRDSVVLCAKGKDRWYVPDPNKAGDLEKLRERFMLKEFEDYLPAATDAAQAGRTSGQKRLKVLRLKAVRAGFKKTWQESNYATIISVSRKISENVLQEDPKLLMWYDQAITRSGEDA